MRLYSDGSASGVARFRSQALNGLRDDVWHIMCSLYMILSVRIGHTIFIQVGRVGRGFVVGAVCLWGVCGRHGFSVHLAGTTAGTEKREARCVLCVCSVVVFFAIQEETRGKKKK